MKSGEERGKRDFRGVEETSERGRDRNRRALSTGTKRGFGIRGHSPESGEKREKREGMERTGGRKREERKREKIAGAKCVGEVNPVSAVTSGRCIGRWRDRNAVNHTARLFSSGL